MKATTKSRVAAAALAVLSCCSVLAAGEAAWKVGLAARKITPDVPVYLAGYANRNRPFDSVADDLFVKALAIEDATGHRAVLVTSDLIGYRADMAEAVCRKIQQQTGLERSQILLNSSHTHTGPLVSLDESNRARDQTEEQARATVAWTRRLIDDTAAAALEALEKSGPARLSYGVGVVHFVMNRREPTPSGVRLGVNPRGLADRSVPVLRIDGADGRLRAVLLGAACHNTTLTGEHYMVSGDYAGAAQRYVEEKHPGAQAMFMLGCAGSANPYPRGSMEHALAHGRELGTEVCRLLDEKLAPVEGRLKTVFRMVELPLLPAPPREEIDRLLSGGSGWQPGAARKMLEILERGESLATHYRCPVALWQFGDDLTLVALSGEVVVDYVPLIERAVGPLDLWIAAYSNDVYGYLPSTQVLREGGYETRGLFSGVGFFAPEAETALVEAVAELADEAGRPVRSGDRK